jgi:hypothetical protein
MEPSATPVTPLMMNWFMATRSELYTCIYVYEWSKEVNYEVVHFFARSIHTVSFKHDLSANFHIFILLQGYLCPS